MCPFALASSISLLDPDLCEESLVNKSRESIHLENKYTVNRFEIVLKVMSLLVNDWQRMWNPCKLFMNKEQKIGSGDP